MNDFSTSQTWAALLANALELETTMARAGHGPDGEVLELVAGVIKSAQAEAPGQQSRLITPVRLTRPSLAITSSKRPGK